MWLEPSSIAGAILLVAFLGVVVSIGACAGCDREYLGLDDETLP